MASRWRKRAVRLGEGQVCGLCRGSLREDADGPLQVCGGCQTVYHRQCVAELASTCATLGCGRQLESLEPEAARPRRAELTSPRPAPAPSGVGFVVAGIAVLLAQFPLIFWWPDTDFRMALLLLANVAGWLLIVAGGFLRRSAG